MVAQVLPWSLNGGTVVTTVIAQWTPLVGQRRHSGGTRKADVSLKLIHNVRIFLLGDQWSTIVHPFCDHGDVCAFILPPLSDLWATDLIGDLCATVLNMLKTSRRPWRPWRCLNVLCATLERPRRPFCLRSAFNGDLTSFVVAQGRYKGGSLCVKGVLSMPVVFRTKLHLLVNIREVSNPTQIVTTSLFSTKKSADLVDHFEKNAFFSVQTYCKSSETKRHYERHGASNHQRLHFLLSRLFWLRSKPSKVRVTGLCEGNSPVTMNSPYKGLVTRKMFPFDDAIMEFYKLIFSFVAITALANSLAAFNGTGHRWIPHTKASDAELWCFLWSAPE